LSETQTGTESGFRDLKLDEIRRLMDSGEYEVVDVREG